MVLSQLRSAGVDSRNARQSFDVGGENGFAMTCSIQAGLMANQLLKYRRMVSTLCTAVSIPGSGKRQPIVLVVGVGSFFASTLRLRRGSRVVMTGIGVGRKTFSGTSQRFLFIGGTTTELLLGSTPNASASTSTSSYEHSQGCQPSFASRAVRSPHRLRPALLDVTKT